MYTGHRGTIVNQPGLSDLHTGYTSSGHIPLTAFGYLHWQQDRVPEACLGRKQFCINVKQAPYISYVNLECSVQAGFSIHVLVFMCFVK